MLERPKRVPHEEDFWNFTHQAQNRAFLERLVVNVTWFFRPFEKGGVTKEVIFGTPIRVSRTCSNNPKFMATAASSVEMAKTAQIET
jgi:chemotaxis methyl-accepting protein methylase